MKNKEEIVAEKVQEMLTSLQYLSTLADCILIEYQNYLHDTPFKNNNVKSKMIKIKTGVEGVYKYCLGLIRVKVTEEEQLNHSLQIHKLLRYFSDMNTEQLENYLNTICPDQDFNETNKGNKMDNG